MRQRVRAGVTTGELDDVGPAVFRRAGARSGPQLDYDFPGVNCISVNDEAVHGVPGKRRLRDGDLVKLDVTAKLDGFDADACVTLPVGRPRPRSAALAQTARLALANALRVARAGMPLNAIGAGVEETVTDRGHAVCRELMGHGIGRRIHESPNVASYFIAGHRPMTAGLVMTIEPIVSAGTGTVRETGDGWTVRTADGALSAHAEHTIMVTTGEPIVLTR
jgi:methionyl aminopeptidase